MKGAASNSATFFAFLPPGGFAFGCCVAYAVVSPAGFLSLFFNCLREHRSAWFSPARRICPGQDFGQLGEDDKARYLLPGMSLKSSPTALEGAIMSVQKIAFAALLCASAAAFGQSGLSVDWHWKGSHQCSIASPALSVSGIPEGTKTLAVTMVDLDVPDYDHGGGAVAHGGGPTASITEGALKNYRGPCPPNFHGFGHDYQFTVRALAGDGSTVLARGSAKKTFSASTVK